MNMKCIFGHKWEIMKRDFRTIKLFMGMELDKTIFTYRCKTCGKVKQESYEGDVSDECITLKKDIPKAFLK